MHNVQNTEDDAAKAALKAEKRETQSKFDATLIANIKQTNAYMKAYLKGRFTIGNKDLPHEMKF